MFTKIGGLPNTFKQLLRHPLNRGRSVQTLGRFLRWQIGSRLVPGSTVIDFVDDAKLLVSPGMTGATGAIYMGLTEFEDMGFLLHCLRPEDLFADVGANVGIYTILSSGAVGARTVAFEPILTTYRGLVANVLLNGLTERAKTHNVAVGRQAGTVVLTNTQGAMDHVVAGDESPTTSDTCAVTTLDEALSGARPAMIKIDVEGFEAEVLAGASATLCSQSMLAVIVEVNSLSRRYGHSEDQFHGLMVELGYQAVAYDPFERTLSSLNGINTHASNTIYVKDRDAVGERVRSSRKYRVHGREI
jgi:FkbM family methyltransferase